MKAYSISSPSSTNGGWHETLQIDDEIFDTHESRCREAIAQSVERWAKSHVWTDEWDEMGPIGFHPLPLDRKICIATPHQDDYEAYVMSTEDVFENIGRQDLLSRLRECNRIEEEWEAEEKWWEENATDEMKAERIERAQRRREQSARRNIKGINDEK